MQSQLNIRAVVWLMLRQRMARASFKDSDQSRSRSMSPLISCVIRHPRALFISRRFRRRFEAERFQFHSFDRCLMASNNFQYMESPAKYGLILIYIQGSR